MPKLKLEVNLAGPEGNVFVLTGMAIRLMNESGMQNEAKTLPGKIFESGSYAKALEIIEEYVEIIRLNDENLE